MKLSDVRKAYYDYTAQTSALVRQLCYAGIAVIWLFKIESSESKIPQIPEDLIVPLFCIVAALAFDFFQYAVASFIWGFYHRCKEKYPYKSKDKDFLAPRYFNWFGIFFFWSKVALVITAYVLLLCFLENKILP